MKKRLLAMAVGVSLSMPLFTGVVNAGVLDNPQDKAYVERSVLPDNGKAQKEALTPAKVEKLAPLANKMVDKQLIPEAAKLYRYLLAVSQAGKVIYGHQNDTHHKMFRVDSGSASDCKDVTGSIAGVVGMDSLSLTGDELKLTTEEKASGVTYTDKLVKIAADADKQGAIITFSMHMPNFDVVAKKPRINGAYDFQGYSPHVLTGDVGKRILPEGDLNEVYRAYLDMVADFALRLQDKHIPVIFRPLHEHNGFWFWWGGRNISSKDFTALWKYTVGYMRDVKGVHNFLYAYSPNGPFADETAYLDRYPGDDYVDILGVDTYDDDQSGAWYKNLSQTLTVMEKLGQKRHKVIALTEAGVRKGGSLAVRDNVDKQWFSKTGDICREHKAAYYMVWANFDKEEHNFFMPYMVDDNRGHEMINEFTAFYNAPESIFADGNTNYKKLQAGTVK